MDTLTGKQPGLAGRLNAGKGEVEEHLRSRSQKGRLALS